MGRHSSGQARCTLNGKVYYLGAYGSLEAQRQYTDLLARWEANERRPLDPAPTVVQLRKVTDLCTDYLAFLDSTGRYRKLGRPTSQRKLCARALQEFCDSCGSLVVAKVTSATLELHRDALQAREHLTRVGVNRKMLHVRAALRWAKRRGMLTDGQWLGIAAMEPLSKAECGGRDWKVAKRIVSLVDVERVALVAPPQVARMLRVQAAIGCRPGEVVAMKWSDLSTEPVDVDGVPCRIYRVADAKNSHHGKEPTTYCLPPAVLALLGESKGPGSYVFPSPLTGGCYSSASYRNAVEVACRRAGVATFAPHCLRHSFLTRAANRYGVLAAAAAANHSSTVVTSGYLHKNALDGYRCVLGLLRDAASAG
jgi:integrase